MIRFLEPLDFTDHSAGEINLITLVEKIFANDESLEKALGFEYRPEQAQMAITYAHSLLDGKHLIFEAGTGVGKSLAYLVPSVIYSILSKRKCVIATNTINLQEQLLDKDIPAVRSLFLRTEGLTQMANFHCALLVGRSNYLCQNRLARALIGQGD